MVVVYLDLCLQVGNAYLELQHQYSLRLQAEGYSEQQLHSLRQKAVAYLEQHHHSLRHQAVVYSEQHSRFLDSQVVLDQLLVEEDLHLVILMVSTSTDQL